MYRYSLTADIHALLDRLEVLRSALDSSGVLPRRWMGRLRRDLEVEAVAASTSMEGVPVTVDEVRRILAGDRPSTVSEADAALVAGYRDAMAFVLRRAEATGFEWQSELFIAIHDRAMGGDFAAGAGDYRSRQVFIGSVERGLVYVPPPPEDVARLVDELAVWLRASEAVPAPVRAALAHVRLAGIHPFPDGNGRVARIVASLVMVRGGYRRPEFTSLEEWWGAHRDDYYAAFACLGDRWEAAADVTPFVQVHLRAQVTQVEALSLRSATERAIWTVLEDIVTEDLNAPPRLANALFDAFFGRSVTNRYYRGLADVQAATAASDLRRLEAAGLLRSVGAGRATIYVGTTRLAAGIAAAAGLPAPEPNAPLEAQRGSIVVGLAEQLKDHGGAEAR
ncbi:MAG: Fic family protein [Ardenticatenales bacterium]